jgi:hypothetical protein
LASLRLDFAHGYLINEASNIVEVLENGWVNVANGHCKNEDKVETWQPYLIYFIFYIHGF